ncbi:unnamed protein product [Lupinus luteus]|uniref:Uncharacterized protein n=1 Tax=Lupinus luteus TaxID=3873 RepID=A0AAV1W2W7_LUPLU
MNSKECRHGVHLICVVVGLVGGSMKKGLELLETNYQKPTTSDQMKGKSGACALLQLDSVSGIHLLF